MSTLIALTMSTTMRSTFIGPTAKGGCKVLPLGMYHFIRWSLLFAVLGVQLVTSKTETMTDWRIVTYEDLHAISSTRWFERNGFMDFARFALDPSNDTVIVGIRDKLLRLRLSDLNLVQVVTWESDNVTIAICHSKGQSKEDCHNFIRVLLVRQNLVFVCGTNSYAPQCSWRKLESLGIVEQWVTGVAKCPYSPHQNSTCVMTTDGNLYSATVTDFTGRDAAIYRMMGPSRHLRTAQYNSRWLNEPDFISSYDIGDYIYFFFREVAVEYINCGKAIYSRVARICKSDSGDRVYLKDSWTTFLKARLNCSLPGNYPFYYNELQSTYYDQDLQLLFAVFTTSPTSIYGSSLCIYNMSSFDQAFSGSFKYQENPQSAWTRAPNNPSSLQCSRGMPQGKRSSENTISSHRHLVDVQKFQMMDSAVQPSSHIPPLLADNERWTHIVADRVPVLFQSEQTEVIVLFVATVEGAIKKFFLLPQPVEINGTIVSACLLEELHLMTPGHPQSIRQMDLVHEQQILLIGTANRLYKLPTHRCHRFNSKLRCESMQDPYCQWNDAVQECQGTGNRNLTSCPQNFPVDGEWSSWSPWQQCSSPLTEQQDVGDKAGEEDLSCQCRSRTCDNPSPSEGGALCSGSFMQVINCTGKAEKKVEGKQHDNGHWSKWGEWTPCSSVCGDGHQTRNRTCQKLSDSSKKGHRHCTGAKKEMRVCNVAPCQDAHNSGNWSKWYVAGAAEDGFHEERLKCSCQFRGSRKHAHLVIDTRFCSTDEHNCTDIDRRLNISLFTSQSCSGALCKKPHKTKKGENTITKQEPNFKNLERINPKSKALSRRLTQRSSFPVGQFVFSGFCGCRDLGLFRICYRCNGP